MKTFLFKTCFISSLYLLASCTHMPTNSGISVFADVTEPLSFDGNVKPIKTGKSCQNTVMFIYTSGDSSIEAAKANGGITKVASANIEKQGRGVFGKSCTIVKGE